MHPKLVQLLQHICATQAAHDVLLLRLYAKWAAAHADPAAALFEFVETLIANVEQNGPPAADLLEGAVVDETEDILRDFAKRAAEAIARRRAAPET